MQSHEQETSLDASRFISSLAIFLSAFLLFQLELIIGKQLLPWFGGVFEVWDTSMFFFQAMLLAGYFWATRIARFRRGPIVHIALMALALAVCVVAYESWGSPILPSSQWRPSAAATLIPGVLRLLAVSIALPFFLLSTTGPLLQAWYARIHEDDNPYWLFGISNLGSLLGLLTYPLLVERYLPLHLQSVLWFGAFCFLLLCLLSAALRARHTVAAPVAAHLPHLRRGKLALWFLLAACGSALMLSLTNLLTQDVASIPLLWVLPLSVYLFSFVVAFAPVRLYWRGLFHPLAAIAFCAAAIGLLRGTDVSVRHQIVLFNAVLFVLCTICHGELALRRPPAARLTIFYLMVGAGGTAGSVMVALVAPLILRSYVEFQISAVGFVILIAFILWRERHSWLHQPIAWLAPFLLTTLAVALRFLAKDKIFALPHAASAYGPLIAFLGLLTIWSYLVNGPRFLERSGARLTQVSALLFSVAVCSAMLWTVHTDTGRAVARWRNFYGALMVREVGQNDPQLHRYELFNGRIIHGAELIDPKQRFTPTTYYGEESGVAIAVGAVQRMRQGGPIRVGAVGLGVGTLAAYSRPGDVYRFYELNPQVIRLAQGEGGYFHFLSDARGTVQVVRGDARLSMEHEIRDLQWQNFDLLVLDAFNGDAIPVHLLTVEAMAVYRQHLRGPDSVIAVHISNYAVNLEPLVAGLAQQYGMHAILIETPDKSAVALKSDWILLCSGNTLRDPEVRASGFEMLRNFPGERSGLPPAPYWTDEKNDVFEFLK